MNILTFDTETTIVEHGHPFHKDNRMVCLGYKWIDQETEVLDFNDSIAELFNEFFAKADLVVGMNLKFDLHWMRRIGCNLRNIKNVWDIQLAYFYLSAQAAISSSLNEISDAYGMGQKVDIIKLEYWDKGICGDMEIAKADNRVLAKFTNEINHLNDLIKQGMIEEFKIMEDTDESLS